MFREKRLRSKQGDGPGKSEERMDLRVILEVDLRDLMTDQI